MAGTSTTKTTRLESEQLSLSSKQAPLLEQIKEADLARVFIGLGAGVDPDGLACQMAMKAIVKHINPDAKVDCFYRGDWDRAQNRTMREVLGLNPKPYSDAEVTWVNGKAVANYTTVFMVDGNASVMPEGVTPHFVIDHHDPFREKALVGEDVRLIGSCSAIMWEYIMALEPELLVGEDGAKLAAALALGITTDTRGKTVEKTSQLDWEAEAYCGIRADRKAYKAIINYPRPSYQKDMELQAWSDKDKEDTVLITQLGVIPREQKGMISHCADEFCGQGPIRTTLVGAMIDGNIHFCFRTLNSSINADSFIKGVITKHGGGKPGAGAGVILMPEVLKGLPEDTQKEIFKAAWAGIAHKTFQFAGGGVRAKNE